MPRGGARDRAGRRHGSKNKATIERELRAAQAAAVLNGEQHKELAIDVLDRLMKVAEGAAGLLKPTEIGAGDWDRFGEWFDRTEMCAKDLAKYQSPTFRAVALMGADPDKGTSVRFVIENAPAMIEAVATEV